MKEYEKDFARRLGRSDSTQTAILRSGFTGRLSQWRKGEHVTVVTLARGNNCVIQKRNAPKGMRYTPLIHQCCGVPRNALKLDP